MRKSLVRAAVRSEDYCVLIRTLSDFHEVTTDPTASNGTVPEGALAGPDGRYAPAAASVPTATSASGATDTTTSSTPTTTTAAQPAGTAVAAAAAAVAAVTTVTTTAATAAVAAK